MGNGLDIINSRLRMLDARAPASAGIVDPEKVKPTAAVSQPYSQWGVTSEIKFSTLVEAFKRSLKFRLAVLTYVSRSVGMGFYNTADLNTTDGKKGLEIVNQFCEDWNLDEKNQLAARDGWMSGNFFMNKVAIKPKHVIDGIFMLPLSSFQMIKRAENGDVIAFVQTWAGKTKDMQPGDILHFRWLPIDEGSFGEGIGQPLARTGMGYKTASGQIKTRPAWFEIEEKMDDISHIMPYAGVPRYYAMFPGADADFINDANNKMNKLDLLQHFVSSVQGEIKSVSLDTQGKFDTFIRHVDDAITTGTMSPLIRLWSSLDFTYASSEQAVKAMDPTIDMYQRAHKRFNEKMIFTPLMEQYGVDPKIAKLRLIWGAEQQMTIEQIAQIYQMLKDPMFTDKFNPDDLIKMLQEAGAKLTSVVKKDIEKTAKDLKDAEDADQKDLEEQAKQAVADEEANAKEKEQKQ